MTIVTRKQTKGGKLIIETYRPALAQAAAVFSKTLPSFNKLRK